MEAMLEEIDNTQPKHYDIGEVKCHVLTPTGMLLGLSKGKIRFLTYERFTHFASYTTAIHCLALTPNAKTCISGSTNGLIKLWNMEQRTEETLAVHIAVLCLAVANNGEFFVSGDTCEVRPPW